MNTRLIGVVDEIELKAPVAVATDVTLEPVGALPFFSTPSVVWQWMQETSMTAIKKQRDFQQQLQGINGFKSSPHLIQSGQPTELMKQIFDQSPMPMVLTTIYLVTMILFTVTTLDGTSYSLAGIAT